MESLDLEGIFWEPNQPERQVVGRLRFDPGTGGELDLIGSFDTPESLGKANDDLRGIRILGVAGRKLLTLAECLKTGSNLEFPGIYRERYRVDQIFAGAHLDDDDGLKFLSISIGLRHLEHWVGKSGLNYSLTEEASSNDISQIQITLKPLPKSSTRFTAGLLELGFTWGLYGDELVEKGLRHGAYLTFTPNENLSIEALTKVAVALQHLITLGADDSAPITSMTLKHESKTRTLSSGKVINEPIEFFAQLQGGDSPETAPKRPYEMLFTFDDLGGISGVAKWIDLAAELEPVVATMLSHRYMPRMYAENRLHNAVFAAETFDRIRFPNSVRPKAEFRAMVRDVLNRLPENLREWIREELQYSNEPRLRARLERLADYAGDTFAALVLQDVGSWARDVKDARNRSVHRDRELPLVGGSRMYLLAETLYFLVSFCLLRDCDVADETLGKIKEHQRFRWLSEQVRKMQDKT